MTIRPRRSVLYMPGSNARAIEKARTLPVDGIILDLEDAVAPDAKVAARAQVAQAVKAGGFGRREVFVRINALDTAWAIEDLTAIAHAGPDAILVPKIIETEQLERIGELLFDIRADLKVSLWAMIETPLAVMNILALAAHADEPDTHLTGFVMGTNDLAKETHARIVPGRAPMRPWFANCIAAARAYGVDILDGVYNNIGDAEGFARECAEARDMGFDGKTIVHPNQIASCNEAFSPGAEEIAEARKIIAVFDQPANKSKGVVDLDGRMVERMHADIARRTVAIADAIARQE
jgi:citrate lyase subunit beta / citryl-CoA lyase